MGTVDLVIILLIAVMAIFGFLKGFSKSLISLMGFALSLALAILLAKVVSNALLSVNFIGKHVAGDSSSLYSWLFKKLPADIENIKTADLATAANVKDLFNSQAPWFLKMLYPLVKSGLTNTLYLSTLDNARQIIALELSFGVFTLLVGVILFIVVRVLSAVVSMLFKGATGGKKKFVGRFFGAGIGAVKGVLYVMIVLIAFSFLSNFSFMKSINQEVQKSTVGAGLADVSVKITSSVMSDKDDDTRYERLLELAGYNPA